MTEAPTMAAQEVEAQREDAEGIQKLRRNFNFLSLCGVGLMTGSTWPSLGGSIVVVLYNGGAPGAIYELIAASVFYWMIATCIAELASAIPSSAGIYHFAAVASGPTHGRVASWYAGWFNALAWTFGAASVNSVMANQILALCQLWNPDYTIARWHTFLIFLAFVWTSCSIVLFANRALPLAGDIGAFLILIGITIIVITCAVMPSQTGSGYAENSFVWSDWINLTGYESNGFVFIMGMLNGAYAVGTPDCVTHLAEEIPEPHKNIPKAIGIQMVVGFATAMAFLITVFYTVNDPTELFESDNVFPLAEVFLQATGTKAGATGLTIVMIAPGLFMSIGAFLTASRIVWSLARDNGTLYSSILGRIHPRWENPFWSILTCAGIATVMSFIYLGSSAAFQAFVGSFVILTTLSYLGAILPYLITDRKYIRPGWFRLPRSVFIPIATISCLYIMAFVVIFCFPTTLPVTPGNMNFTSVIIVGISVLMGVYWFARGRHQYQGPSPELLRAIQGIESQLGDGGSSGVEKPIRQRLSY